MENMAQPNFGEECKEELQKREDVMKTDYRYDVGVAENCEVRVGGAVGCAICYCECWICLVLVDCLDISALQFDAV
jgi:hypothetical protein